MAKQESNDLEIQEAPGDRTSAPSMGSRQKRPRNARDAYYTPDPLALAICARVAELMADDPPGEVIEPSAGRGAFVRAARATWPAANVIAVELEPAIGELQGAGATSVIAADWLGSVWKFATNRGRARRLVLGNPPWGKLGDIQSQAEAHVFASLSTLGAGDVLAFLLRLSFLGGVRRARALYSQPGLRALIPIAPRPSFTNGGNDMAEYAAFVWQAGFRGPAEIGLPIFWRDASQDELEGVAADE